MKKIATHEEIIAIEKSADRNGLSYGQMMENAGKKTAEVVYEKFPDMDGYRVVVLVGPGNNGGDGLVAAYYLKEHGANVTCFLSSQRGKTDKNYARAIDSGLVLNVMESKDDQEALETSVASADIIVDALLGTGFGLPMRDPVSAVLKVVRSGLDECKDRPFIVAVDCPSGLEVDTGRAAVESIPADLTVSFAVAKHGFFKLPGAALIGKLVITDIGIPIELEELSKITVEMPEETDIKAIIPQRPLDAHKGTFGKLLVIAGSVNYPGAAALAAASAYRAGAGLVTLAVPGNIQQLIAPGLFEATWLLLPHEVGVIHESAVDVIKRNLNNFQAVIVGPGIGREPITRSFLQRLLLDGVDNRKTIGFLHEGSKGELSGGTLPPTVIDADGLNLLSEMPEWSKKLPVNTVLTPHPGEMARLTGLPIAEIQADRIAIAQNFSNEWGAVLVLKGAFTVVAEPSGRTAVIPMATPVLATAGTGDVLTGVIGSLMAQGVDPYQAAVAGAYIHGTAGLLCHDVNSSSIGVTASEICDFLPFAISQLM